MECHEIWCLLMGSTRPPRIKLWTRSRFEELEFVYWNVLPDDIFAFFIPSIQHVDIDNGSGDNLPANLSPFSFPFLSRVIISSVNFSFRGINDRNFTSTRIVYRGNGSSWVFTMTNICCSFEDENPSSHRSVASFVWISIYFHRLSIPFFVLISSSIPTLALEMGRRRGKETQKIMILMESRETRYAEGTTENIWMIWKKLYFFVFSSFHFQCERLFRRQFHKSWRPFVSISSSSAIHKIYNDKNNTSEKQHKTWWNFFFFLSFSTLLAFAIRIVGSFLSYFSVSHYRFSTHYTTYSPPRLYKQPAIAQAHKKALLQGLSWVPSSRAKFCSFIYFIFQLALTAWLPAHIHPSLISSASISIFMYVPLLKNLK